MAASSRSIHAFTADHCIAWTPDLADVLVHSVTALTVNFIELEADAAVGLRISAVGNAVFDQVQPLHLIARCYPEAGACDGIWEFAFCCAPPRTKVLQRLTPVEVTLDWRDYPRWRDRIKGITVVAQTNQRTVLLPDLD